MKIAFNRRQEKPTIGPFIFLERLIAYLENYDVEVVRNTGRYHELQFINISGSGRDAKRWKAKTILRVDGIYHDLSINSEQRNESIRDTYHNVDGIIFQCQFARTMLYKHFGKPQKAQYEAIIYNGVDESFSPQGNRIDFGFQHSIVVSGKWCWPSKRLPQMIDSFLALGRKDLGLVVLGEVDTKIVHPQIKYVGFVSPNELPSYYRGADIMLHLAYTDWCPNSVIEALGCGVPVITTHNGGVPELIQGSGVIIKNESDYDLEFLDHNNLPKINTALMGEAIDIVLYNRKDFIKPRPDLTIEYCGQQYLNFFRKVLGK